MNSKNNEELEVPNWRPHDHESKRGVKYWWAPEWVRELNGKAYKIRPLKNIRGGVDLHIESKNGNTTYIQGSIQVEFRKWHEDREIDYVLLGEDPDEMLEVDREAAKSEKRV